MKWHGHSPVTGVISHGAAASFRSPLQVELENLKDRLLINRDQDGDEGLVVYEFTVCITSAALLGALRLANVPEYRS
jgi:hypothetical protein